MCIHEVGLLIPCIVQYIYLALFLNIAVNLWSNGVNPMNLHRVIWVSESFAVLQIISHAEMFCCVYCAQC